MTASTTSKTHARTRRRRRASSRRARTPDRQLLSQRLGDAARALTANSGFTCRFGRRAAAVPRAPLGLALHGRREGCPPRDGAHLERQELKGAPKITASASSSSMRGVDPSAWFHRGEPSGDLVGAVRSARCAEVPVWLRHLLRLTDVAPPVATNRINARRYARYDLPSVSGADELDGAGCRGRPARARRGARQSMRRPLQAAACECWPWKTRTAAVDEVTTRPATALDHGREPRARERYGKRKFIAAAPGLG